MYSDKWHALCSVQSSQTLPHPPTHDRIAPINISCGPLSSQVHISLFMLINLILLKATYFVPHKDKTNFWVVYDTGESAIGGILQHYKNHRPIIEPLYLHSS